MSSSFIPNEAPLVVKHAIEREMAGFETLNWQIFTDGASSPDGRGGWAYVVVKDGIEIRRAQGSALGVTHQRMEIRAVAEALLDFPRDVPVKVIGDSAYVIECFGTTGTSSGRATAGGTTRGSRWRTVTNGSVCSRPGGRGRRRRPGDRVPGHGKGKHPWNDLADTLAVEAKGYR